MKKAAFFLFILLTFYLSAMYRSGPLLLLCLAELIFAVCMWGLARYLKSKIELVCPRQNIVQEVNHAGGVEWKVIHHGRWFPSHFRLRLRVCYLHETHGDIRYLYGMAEPGTNTLRFEVRAPCCGLVCLRVEDIRVYDFLGLFCGKTKLPREMEIAVLPPNRPMALSADGWEMGAQESQESAASAGGTHGDIRELREYRPGDPTRHIHWNQTARTGRLWVKEYQRESDTWVDLSLNFRGLGQKSSEELDVFYRVLYALLLGTLRDGVSVKVHWYSSGQLTEMLVLDEPHCQDLLLRLYRLSIDEMEPQGLTHADQYQLDLDLHLYQNGIEIRRFTPKEVGLSWQESK